MPPQFAVWVVVVGAWAGLTLGAVRTPAADVATSDVACAVAAPHGSTPIRTDSFGSRLTVIAVAPGQVPNPVPAELDRYLKEQGAVLARRLKSGRISVKAAWLRDRRAAGRVNVTGQRLDRPGGSFRSKVNRHYGGKNFARIVPSELILSSTGCWRVQVRAGKARVTYDVQVRDPGDGEL